MSRKDVSLSLESLELRELGESVLVRTWKTSDGVPEWFAAGLRAARPVLGDGVIDPIELGLGTSALRSLSLGPGRTLARYLVSAGPMGESSAGFLFEQVCFATLRVHEGLGAVHGAINPINFLFRDDFSLHLWSLPTLRLEQSWGGTRQWEDFYRSPQVLAGESPTFSDDIFSLGRLFARLLLGSKENFDRWIERPEEDWPVYQVPLDIVKGCTRDEPEERYSSVRDILRALRGSPGAVEMDVSGAKEDSKRGVESFGKGDHSQAVECFQAAVDKDRGGASAYNNLGVAWLAEGRPEEALPFLLRARELAPHHPLVEANIGSCFLKKNDTDRAGRVLKEACRRNPGSLLLQRCLAQCYREQGHLQEAFHSLRTCLHLTPSCRMSRRLLAELLREIGDEREASRLELAASQTSEEIPLSDHLLTEESPQPWNCCFKGERSMLERLGPIRKGELGTLKI